MLQGHPRGLGPPLPGSATPRIYHSQGPPLSGAATPRVCHSQGLPLLGSATPRVSHYMRYPNITSIQLPSQQIIIILINSNFYLHYDFSSIPLQLTLW